MRAVFESCASVVQGFLTYQVVKNTLVQRPLKLPALPELLVVVVEAFPVLAELGQAVLVDVVQPKCMSDTFSGLSNFPTE